MLPAAVHKDLQLLEHWFSQNPKTITAFSGGIDSTMVLYLAHKFLGQHAVGCISASASLKSKDLALAKKFCADHDILLEVVVTKEMKDPNYLENPANRCYFCKNHLYMALTELSSKYPDYAILNGTNADDLGDYRPGLVAAKEFAVKSPLVDCGIGKDGVRAMAKHLGIKHWDKPASPCLSSRLPYGTKVSIDKLLKIERAEEIINRYGFANVRVRYYDDQAKIEVPRSDLDRLASAMHVIEPEVLKVGFDRCIIDREGLVSGKLNRALGDVR